MVCLQNCTTEMFSNRHRDMGENPGERMSRNLASVEEKHQYDAGITDERRGKKNSRLQHKGPSSKLMGNWRRKYLLQFVIKFCSTHLTNTWHVHYSKWRRLVIIKTQQLQTRNPVTDRLWCSWPNRPFTMLYQRRWLYFFLEQWRCQKLGKECDYISHF